MIRTALRGLRGRLLLSLVFTSAVTLVVAAAITIGPLQSRLRDESAGALQESTESVRSDFSTALSETKLKTERQARPESTARTCEKARRNRANELSPLAFDLRDRTNGARVLVTDLSFTDRFGEDAPAFLVDTDSQPDDASALRLAIRGRARPRRRRRSIRTTS